MQALEKAQQEESIKVLLLRGLDCGLLRGGREAYNEAIEQNLYQILADFPYPSVALLEGDAVGAGFLAAALCDFMVCNEDATYEYTDVHTQMYPTIPETILFKERFGDSWAEDFLYASSGSTGKQLRSRGWMCPVLPKAQVEAYAQKLAIGLATKPRNALSLLEQHLTRRLGDLVKVLTRVEPTIAATGHSADTIARSIEPHAKHLHLDRRETGVLIIGLRSAEKTETKDLIADLGDTFAQIQQDDHYKAIVLTSEHRDFLPAIDRDSGEQMILDFQRLVLGSRIPVIATLDRDATGYAWLLGLFCDACVYNRTGVYSLADLWQSPALARTAVAIFAQRFGYEAANEILLTGADYSGADLQRRVGALVAAERDQVLPAALKVAESWARLPHATLVAWKKHSAAILQEKISSLPAAGWEQEDEAYEPMPSAPTTIALHSLAVTTTAHPEGIVVVKMEDREAKNLFSEVLIEGVREAFAHIERTPSYKVVILTGFDTYFASGGTKESLLAIQQGKAKFTDLKILQAPLDCQLPVIAAMQGHGIGAGWAMGMLADIVLLSEESRYGSPYMNYGFTPGAGATWILAEKLGQDLARESLLAAVDYAGSDLKDRGLRLRILPRAEINSNAQALAGRIALVSRARLIDLKRQLTGHIREQLEETYRLELAMHEKTFVGSSDTLAKIENNFYQAIEASPVDALQPEYEASPTSSPSVDGDTLATVIASLKTLLADELQMRESDIDESIEFVDLGLDSISGVAWVRKINEKYHTSIEATKVYHYPTLVQLSRYVKSEAEKQETLRSPIAIPATLPRSRSPFQISKATKLAAPKLASWRSEKASRFITGSAPLFAAQSITAQPIAVIGMAGQFPQAKNLDEFWQNIAGGKNCISEVPSRRWDVDLYYQAGEAVAGKSSSRWAGMLEEYDLFDPLFFNISPTEAESMDPQQRLFLQACWHTIENAGYAARVLSGSKCGVFAGCASGDYHQLS
ncbi:MAG: enoyl-CoA hydratase/isomerase family protein, partial [Blastocatellia bacterium]|nr:enoyl-CoA hydratase/isomerase family protein [Blastocatellia bacterium]